MASTTLFSDIYGDAYGTVFGSVFQVAQTATAGGSYITYADMTRRYDERTIKDLLSDSGSPVVELELDETLAVLMQDATGIVNAAIQVGNAYTSDQIDDLLALDNTGTAHLKRVVCDITMALLLMRRPEKYKSAEKRMAEIEQTVLDPIRHGRRIFNVPGRSTQGSLLSGDEIRISDIHRTNPITHRTRHYYPRRESSLPRNRN